MFYEIDKFRALKSNNKNRFKIQKAVNEFNCLGQWFSIVFREI